MKKLLMILSIAFFCYQSSAQLSKGRMMLSGLANYNSTSNSGDINSPNSFSNQIDNSKSLAVSLNAGYFFSSHLAIGLYGSYRGNSSEGLQLSSNITNVSNSKQTNHLFAAGVFGRYYQMIGSSRFAFFGQANVAYNWGSGTDYSYYQYNSSSSNTSDVKTTSTGYSIGVSPGVTFFINKSFAVETTIGSFAYNHLSNVYFDNGSGSPLGTGDSHGLNASLSLSTIYLGISYYFGGPKTKTP